jgi:hypothetical protein
VVIDAPAVVYVDHFVEQALEGAAAWPFHEHLQTRFPALLSPGFDSQDTGRR